MFHSLSANIGKIVSSKKQNIYTRWN